jgi:small subunit ribosomal protein S9
MAKPILSSGKRKRSIARARLIETESNPEIRVNGFLLDSFGNTYLQTRIMEPITLLGDIYKNNLNIKVKVQGGGFMSQTDAIRIALARALEQYYGSSEVSAIFNDYDATLISGDVRRREPKKFGGSGARARYQKSYR